MQFLVNLIVVGLFAYISVCAYLDEVDAKAIEFLSAREPAQRFASQNDDAKSSSIYLESKISRYRTPHVHSATLTELGLAEADQSKAGDSKILAVWYGGTREGAKDVALYSSVLTTADSDESMNGGDGVQWAPSQLLLTAADAQRDLGRYIKKLGNPVLFTDSNHRVHLFYVTVSLGGWAGAAINHQVSQDDGETWSKSKRLITSPFVNISTLVKSPPFEFSDGSLGLPVYHEFLGKFSEIVHLSPTGDVHGKVRIDSGRITIQPLILADSSHQAKVYMRSVDGAQPYVKTAILTIDNASVWQRLLHIGPITVSDYGRLTLPNSDAAVAGVHTGKTSLLVFNNSKVRRDILSLAIELQGQAAKWSVIHDFESAKPGQEGRYSYPYMITSSNGWYHLAYSWNRDHIKHIQFNEDWLEENRP